MTRIAIIQTIDYGPGELIRPLILPDGMDLDKEEREMLDLYPVNACPVNLVDFLISKGTRLASTSEVEVYER